MKLALGADHAGFACKNELAAWLREEHEVLDLGAAVLEPEDDYPDFARKVASAVASGAAERGVLVCGSGVGACIAANKVPGARACLCHETCSARQGVEDDDMNILCLGSRVVSAELIRELVRAFIGARFRSDERFRRRLAKVLAIEREALCRTSGPG